MKLFVLCAFSLLMSGAPALGQKTKLKKIFGQAEAQTRVLLEHIPDARKDNPELVSPRTLENGAVKMVASRDWTSGFFPGLLWYLYEYTRDTMWKNRAAEFTSFIEREKTNGGTHDMGFKIYSSVGNGYRLTNDPHYREVIIQSAQTLITRFNKQAGVIRSWDHNRDKWDYPVIIDNMLNLELLFAATQLTGDSVFHRIAVIHANTTMANHFRADNSSFHVVDYDTATGNVRKKTTHQGFSNESAWARGQAWAVYGYTMCYRFTRDPRYLDQAEKVADYMLSHPNMPADLIPYWDYNAPDIPNEERDASAGAVLGSALFELASFSRRSREYRKKAEKILQSLTQTYRAAAGTSGGFILLHSTGSRPAKSEVDVPLNYADYYYVEALLRCRDMK